MCSRNEEKIKEQLATMKGVKTKALAIDLGNQHSIAAYREILATECEGLDIALAFLNAGSMTVGPVDLISDKQLEMIITLNGLHVVYMAKVLLEGMMKRNSQDKNIRSALVVTSSGVANFPIPGLISYSTSKILVSRFCQATAEELRDKRIDVMTWEAGPIKTKLNKGEGPMVLPCKSAVNGCFSKIGFESKTDGPWLHELLMVPAPLFSLTLFGSKIASKTR